MMKEDFEFDRCVQAVLRSGAKTVGLQFPAGLKTRAVDIARQLQDETDIPVILSADPSFGACDVKQMPVDLIVHLGHAPIPDLHYKNVFFYDNPLPPPENLAFLDKALPLPGKHVGLLTTTQFRGWIPKVKEYLQGKGYDVYVGKTGGRIAYEGQLLGCDYSVARAVEKDVDCFLYVGSGDFHPLAVALLTPKPIVVADFEKGTARNLDDERDRTIRQRHGAIVSAQSANTFGIIVSTKLGQHRMELAQYLLKLAEKHGKAGQIFIMDLVNQDALDGYRIDAWVNTACPRVAIEDYLMFKKPILTPQEFEIVLGERKWRDYEMDEIRA